MRSKHTRHQINSLVWGLILILALSLPLSTALMNASATLILGLYLLGGDYQEKYRQLKSNWIVMLLIGFFLWTCLSGFYAEASSEFMVHDLFKYKKLLLLPALIYFLKGRNLEHCLYAFLFGVFGGIAYTYWVGHGLVLSLQAQQFLYTTQSLRNYITEGFFLAIALFWVLWNLKKQRHVRWMMCFLLVIVVQILFNHGRMGLLSVLLSLALLIHWGMAKNRLKIVGVLVLVLGACFLYGVSPLIQERVMRTWDEAAQLFHPASTDSIRVQYWFSSFELFLIKPIWGMGPGAFRQMIMESGKSVEYTWGLHAHNEYIMILLQYGVVGLTLVIAALYLALRRFCVERASSAQVVACAGIWIFLLNCITDAFLFNSTEGYTFVLLMAILLTPGQRSSTAYQSES